MGIKEKDLSNFELKSKGEVKIELNESKIIHLHLGDFRLELTKQEFRELSENIKNSGKSLRNLKNENK